MSPRPNPVRTNGAEEATRANIRRLLDEQDRTVAWLERKADMVPASLHKILKGGRTIYVNEAVAIAHVLGVTVGDLVRKAAW